MYFNNESDSEVTLDALANVKDLAYELNEHSLT